MDGSKYVKGLLFVWVPLLFLFIKAVVFIWTTKSTGFAVAPDIVSGRQLSAMFLVLAVVACEIYGGFLLSGVIAKGQLLRNFLAVVSIGVAALCVFVQVVNAVRFLRTPHL